MKIYRLLPSISAGFAAAVLCVASAGYGAFINWTPFTNLNLYAPIDNAQETRAALASDENGTAVAIWHQTNGISIAQTQTGGDSWIPAFTQTAPGAAPDAADITYAGNTTFVALWGYSKPEEGNKVAISSSVDNGLSWSQPVEFPADFASALDIASDGAGTVIATVEGVLFRSTDHGQTWTQSSPITNPSHSLPRASSKITWSDAGKWVHVYRRVEIESGSSAIKTIAAISENGSIWTEQYLDIDAAPEALAASGSTFAAVFNDPFRELSIVTSRDAGSTWSVPAKVGGTTRTPPFVALAAKDDQWILAYTQQPSSIAIYSSTDDAVSFSPLSVLGGDLKEAYPSLAPLNANDFLLSFHQFAKSTPEYFGEDWDVRSARISSAGVVLSGYINPYAEADLPRMDDQQLDMDASPAGTVIAAWGASQRDPFFLPDGLPDSEVLFARSEDSGKTWSNPAPMKANAATDVVNDRTPHVTFVGGQSWFAYWFIGTSTFFSTSTDDGNTWSAEKRLAEALGVDFVSVASNQNGILMLVVRNDSGSSTIYRSENNGDIWTLVHTGTHFGTPIHTGGTKWLVAGSGLVTVSADNGNTWETVASTPAVNLSGMEQLVSDHNGTVVAITAVAIFDATLSTYRVWTARSQDNGRTWALAEIQEQNSALRNGRVAPTGDGRWVAVWSQGYTMYSTSEDNGLTWGPPELVTVPSAGEPGQNTPEVVHTRGNVTVAWASPIGINWEYGNDTDLFYANADLGSEPPPPVPALIHNAKPAIKLNFAKPSKDSITIKGEVPIPAGFNALALPVAVDIGGVQRTFVLDAKGKGAVGSDKIKLKFKSRKGVVDAQLAKLQVSLKNGSFAAELLDEGLINADVQTPVTINCRIFYSDSTATADLQLFYKAKVGKKGTAK